MSIQSEEIIVVRSLAESDLGIFSAQRPFVRSKQRAININACIAKLLLNAEIIASGGCDISCVCILGDIRVRSRRSIKKVHKNWRLGGQKIEGPEFAMLDSLDFLLLRAIRNNDGTSPLIMRFVCKKIDRVIHAGIAAIVGRDLRNSMAVYTQRQPSHFDLLRYCDDDFRSNHFQPGTNSPPMHNLRAVLPLIPVPSDHLQFNYGDAKGI